MKEFKVYADKKKTILYLMGSLMLILASLMLIFINIWYAIIGGLGILFFGLCFFYYVYKLFSRKPSIILNDKGIIDNSTFGSTGLIKWEDIKEVKIYDFNVKNQYGKSKQKFLGIIPKDINKFIESQKGLKNKLLIANQNYVDTPINIPQSILKINLEDLDKEIRKRMKNRS